MNTFLGAVVLIFSGLVLIFWPSPAAPRPTRRLNLLPSLAEIARVVRDRIEADASGWWMDEYKCGGKDE